MSNLAETRIQAGIETTPGTAVAADRIIYALAPVPEEVPGVEHVPQSRASYEQFYDMVETHRSIEGWTHEFEAVPFDDLVWWLQLAAKGGVTGVDQGAGSGPYLWTFDHTSGVDDRDTATFEIADNVGAFQIPYGICASWEIAGEGGTGPSPVTASFELLGQKVIPAHTMTAALSDRDLRGNYMLFKNTQLFLDDTAAAIGGTEIPSLEAFSISMDNQLAPRFLGGDSGYYETHRFNKTFLEFSATFLFDADTYAEFQDKFQAGSSRYIQLKNTGSGNDLLTLDLHTKINTFEWPEDDGARQVAIMGQSIYDPTLGYGWQLAVQNDVQTL